MDVFLNSKDEKTRKKIKERKLILDIGFPDHKINGCLTLFPRTEKNVDFIQNSFNY